MGTTSSSAVIYYNPDDYIDETSLDLYPGNYVNCGLYPEIADYNKTGIDVARMPFAEQLNYADAISRRYAKNPVFLKQMSAYAITAENIRNINATGVGNMAFIVHHNPANEHFGAQYKEMIKLLTN